MSRILSKLSQFRWIVFVILAFLILVPATTYAKVVRSGDSIYVGAEEIIDDNFYALGQSVDLAGTFNNDVFVLGNSVSISGVIKGDVIGVANTLLISGRVDGNIRVVGADVRLRGLIGKNLNVFGGNVILDQECQVGNSVLVGANIFDLRGQVGANLDGWVNRLSIYGAVANNADLVVGSDNGRLVIYPAAKIGQNLTYQSVNPADIKEGAWIGGQTSHQPLLERAERLGIRASVPQLFSLFILAYIFSSLIIGLVVVSIGGKKIKETIDEMRSRPWRNLGLGLVYFIVTPVACLILLIPPLLFIAAPLSLLVLFVYLIFLAISDAIIGVYLGYWILEKLHRYKKVDNQAIKPVSMMAAMVLGVLLFSLICVIPIIGWIIRLVGVWWAFGAVLTLKKKMVVGWHNKN
ncbi:MAG: hypothetical protein WC480_02015 [Patescibacteria group bacterium]